MSCLVFPFPPLREQRDDVDEDKGDDDGRRAVKGLQQSEKLFPFNASYVYAYACMNISLETFIPVLPLFASSPVLLRQPRKHRFQAPPDCLTAWKHTYYFLMQIVSNCVFVSFYLPPNDNNNILFKQVQLFSQRWSLACSAASSFALSCIPWMLILGTFLISST